MPVNGYEKAAIFLSSIGEEAAAEVLKALDAQDIGKITMHMTRMKRVNRAIVDDVFKEAEEMLSKGDLHMGGEEYVRKVLSKGLGEDGAVKILEMASKEGPLDSLKWIDSRTLSNFLQAEHPQTIALVICLLEPVQASEVLASLPETIKADVAMRIATTERIPESAIEELNEVLKGQLEIGKGKGKKLGGAKTIAEILNHVDRTTEQTVLEKIEEQNDMLADSIRRLMFVFDDLVKVDDRGIQMILKEISTEDLLIALKTASEALKEKIYKNMSQKATQILKEEMQTKGPVRVSDVEKAQQNIVKAARKLETEGRIVLAGRGGEEFVE
ncbi:MAG TPA: flagellar motor switch protein FliG [Nitrospiraceae bacterium]|jgi:flagellar motor switch protein FliG|nr:flagellar motor switch protein FliG [Nitrospiraceae bacterium]